MLYSYFVTVAQSFSFHVQNCECSNVVYDADCVVMRGEVLRLLGQAVDIYEKERR